MELRNENNMMMAAFLIVASLGSFALFGISGLRTALGIFVFIFLPFYLILNNFDLSQSENAVFSFFIGITLFPSLVYWLGFVVPFRISVLVVFAVLLIAGFFIKRFWKK